MTPDDGNVQSPVLVVVHPGSACGSADMNLGVQEGRRRRAILSDDVAAWIGPVIIIDASLSDELGLRAYRRLGLVIEQALGRAQSAGHIAMRINADDAEEHNQVWAAEHLCAAGILVPGKHRVEVTGCWHDPAGKSGCVTSVWHVFKAMDFNSMVRSSAIEEPVDELSMTEAWTP
jgi:hypothetical protein